MLFSYWNNSKKQFCYPFKILKIPKIMKSHSILMKSGKNNIAVISLIAAQVLVLENPSDLRLIYSTLSESGYIYEISPQVEWDF